MINFNTYRLLNESLGYSLGIRPVQSIGLASNIPIGEAEFPGKPEFGGDPMNGDPMNGPPNDNMDAKTDEIPDEDHEENDHEDLAEKIKKLEAEIAELRAKINDDEDDDLDHEDDLSTNDKDGGEEMPSDEETPMLPPKKPVTSFMKKESHENKDHPTFMMKKNCGTGDTKNGCKKCSTMKKESTGYERPKGFDNSEQAWLDSVTKQIAAADVRQKFNDGMNGFTTTEDYLITPAGSGLENSPGPGEVGFAPQNKIGDAANESIRDILQRLEKLEK